MKTTYELHQGYFSSRAHLAAREEVYPKLFSTNDIEYENETVWLEEYQKILDGQMGVDVIVRPHNPSLDSKLSFYIQERFRRPGQVPKVLYFPPGRSSLSSSWSPPLAGP